MSEDEKNKEVKGPRANNYGVKSNVPPDNPSKCVHMLDVEDLQVRFGPRLENYWMKWSTNNDVFFSGVKLYVIFTL